MTFITKSLLFVLSVIILLLVPSTTKACICMKPSSCEAIAGISMVFTGTVINKGTVSGDTQIPSNAMSTSFINGRSVSHFKVEELFIGNDIKEIDISGGGSTCDFYFEVGKRYLVYAYEGSDGKTLFTSICAATSLYSEAKENLAYLRLAKNLKAEGTVSGTIKRDGEHIKNHSEEVPIPKAEIILTNKTQTFKTISDVKGNFELGGLPKGLYKIRTNPRTNYSRQDVSANEPIYEWEIDVPERGCIKTWFLARPEGEISGTVVDDSGVVAEDVEPELIALDAPEDNNLQGVRLGDFRSFRFTFLPPGRYYLGFNMKSGPSLEQPYPEFYYPGVYDRSQAKIITIGEGQKVAEIYLQRPPRLAERMVEGIAVWENGKPAAFQRVELNNPRTGYTEGNSVETDSQGRFSIRAIEGQTYELSALVQKGIPLVNTKPLRITVGAVNTGIKFVIYKP